MAAHARIQSGTDTHRTKRMGGVEVPAVRLSGICKCAGKTFHAEKELARDWRTLCRNIGGYDHYQYDPNRHLNVTDRERRLLAQFVD